LTLLQGNITIRNSQPGTLVGIFLKKTGFWPVGAGPDEKAFYFKVNLVFGDV
jgi:hypothetical protein